MNAPLTSRAGIPPHLGFATLLHALLALIPVRSSSACTQSQVAPPSRHLTGAAKQHRAVIQMSENDPEAMNLALKEQEWTYVYP